MIYADIPQIAYKTWAFEYRIYDEDGNRNFELEQEAEQSLEKTLSKYPYSSDNPHIK